jgi:hypothetical protein
VPSGAKALIITLRYGTAEAVLFVEGVFPIWLLGVSAHQTILATKTIRRDRQSR